jgi:GIY-YIG catalytic domain
LASRKDPPSEVAKIRREIAAFFKTKDPKGRAIGGAPGVYAFYDYDGEPIYVGQSVAKLSDRVGRHLTGRRSDAVGKFVLDPFEVLNIQVWPLPDLGIDRLSKVTQKRAIVNPYEYTVYDRLLRRSRFGAILNEGAIQKTKKVKLPKAYAARIIPDELWEARKHPDVRLARRTQTVASLARLISERKVGRGLRQTLHVQTQRINWLAEQRLQDFLDEPLEAEDND